jgi:alpha-L-rhamnosidase
MISKHLFCIAFAACLVIGVPMLSCIAAASAVEVTNLRCEYRENPMGIDAVKPRLSWVISEPKSAISNLKSHIPRSQKQSAYQILVAGTEELLKKDEGDLWDSGKMASDESVNRVYDGKPLDPSTYYVWKVRVWDGAGRMSSWSDHARFLTGLRAWQGKWIGAAAQVQGGSAVPAIAVEEKAADALVKYPHAAILLRKEIKVDKPVKRALVAMSGLGWSELSLNGKKVGDAALSPQFSDYNKRVPYVMYDVTGQLQKDANAIGVILGNGFSATPNLGYLKWYGNGGQPRLLFQMTVDYVDGTRQTVVSDESWKWSTGEITFNDLWVSEHVDARLAQPGWDITGFNDVEWHPALDVSAPRGKLFARTIPSIRVLETSLPVKIDGDKFIFDAVGAGWLRLKVNGQAGDKVIVNYQAGGYGVSTEYLLKGGGEEVFEPKFLFHTIDRVVTVAGLRQTPTNDTLTRCSAQIDLRRVGSFECSSDFLNRQYEALLRTQRNYNYDYPMDPTREKSGWTQDVMTMINSSVYDFDTAAFYWNWWQDMRVNQRVDGYLGSVVPLVNRVLDDCNCVWWSGMIVYTPWKLYEYYGDRRFIEESYPAMVSYMNWLATKADADKVVAWGLGDWIEVGTNGAPQRTSVAITSTCGYYYFATILSRVAALLGKADESAKYAKLAEEIKAGFNRRFLNTQTGQVGTNPDTQTAQIVPLYFGMVPAEQRQKVLDRLVANIHERKDHLSTGFIGTLHLLLGLPELGQAELTHKMVMQQDYPGWNTLVKDGVQMETWAGGQVQMPSLGGPIGAYLYQVLGGIRPDPKGPGFKKIMIKPAVVGDLTWVKTHLDSPYGRIVSNWKRDGNKLTMEVTIPINTTAVVYVPAKDAAGVTESGLPAAQAKGVKFLRMENGAAVYEVESGSYRFQSTLLNP